MMDKGTINLDEYKDGDVGTVGQVESPQSKIYEFLIFLGKVKRPGSGSP